MAVLWYHARPGWRQPGFFVSFFGYLHARIACGPMFVAGFRGFNAFDSTFGVA
jgi:hypothetical protein